MRGYRQALEESGLGFDSRLLFRTASFSTPEGARVAEMLIDSGAAVDAVFCANDSLAFGVLRRLAGSGVRVPDDMLVIGFDNVLEARYSIPSLSTIAADHVQMAKTAVDLLAAQIAKAGASAEPTGLISDYHLVVRESTSVRAFTLASRSSSAEPHRRVNAAEFARIIAAPSPRLEACPEPLTLSL